MFIIKGPQQNSKKWYISKTSKNMLTPTASNRFSGLRSWRDYFARGTVLEAEPSREARKPRAIFASGEAARENLLLGVLFWLRCRHARRGSREGKSAGHISYEF